MTTFDNPWRALMRFDIGDLARLAARPCPCGRRAGLTLRRIEGRVKNLTLTPRGRLVTEAQIDDRLAGVAGLAFYQLRQTGPAGYALRAVAGDGQSRAVAAGARDAIRALYGPGARVEVRIVPELEAEPSGKFRRVLAEFPIPVEDHLDARYG